MKNSLRIVASFLSLGLLSSGLVAQTVPESIDVVLAVIVILIEHGDPGVRPVLDDVLGEDGPLGL